MTLAVAGFWLWGWIAGGIRKLFRRKKEKRVSLSMSVVGKVKRPVFAEVGVSGSVLRPVSLTLSMNGHISKLSLWFFLDEVLGLFDERGDMLKR